MAPGRAADAAERATDGGRAPTSGLEPWAVDALLGVGVTLTVSLVIAADLDGSGDGGWAAYLWAIGLGGLMLVRRRHPVLVLALSVVGLFAYYAAGLPPIGVAVPVAAAVFSAAEAGRLVAAAVASGVVLGVSTAYRLAVGQDPGYVLAFELPGHLLLLAAAAALGDGLRSRRTAQARADEVTALVAERTRRQAEERIAAERLAVARDLHDSLGHAMAVVSLHSQVAREAIGRDDDAARAALDVIATTTGRANADLRGTVSALRRPGEARREIPRLAGLDAAYASARAAGIEVIADVDERMPLSAPVEAAVYRIVQESITNVVRHADASEVRITAGVHDGILRLEVVDDGGVAEEAGDGHGIVGMRERAEALGGTLEAFPTDAGFAVHATLPIGSSERTEAGA
ncbi:MAG TPA: histidine kinase [Agromyces sp.]